MMRTSLLFLLLPLVAAFEYARLAPFTAVRWNGDRPEAEVDGVFVALEAIDGHDVADVLEFCARQYGGKARKRFAEDLVQALSEMGHPPGDTVALVVADLATGERRTLPKVAMTERNRRRAWEYNQRAAAEPRPRRGPLARADALHDLQVLGSLMEERFSYCHRRGVDLQTAIDAVARALPDPVSYEAFAIAVMELLAPFGDGHAGPLESLDDLAPPGCLPFLIELCGERPVAVRVDRQDLVDPERPYVVALDGRPIDEWIAAVAPIVADGNPEYRRRRAVRHLRFVQWARDRLGLPRGETVEVTLAADRGRARTVKLPVVAQKPYYGTFPRRESGVLEGNVGYLRIPSMESLDDPAREADYRRWMETFRSTKGLIIDVRGNGGGSRDLAALLVPYFLDPAGPPIVVNVAAKRLVDGERAGDPEGLLANRRLFPRDSRRHDDAARAAIDRTRATFAPEWTPPADDFSDWHWFVIAPATANGTYHYDRPVVVLQDVDCFSATDIFLGALAEVAGVTRIGTTSGGGSGRAAGYRLPRSGLELRLSTMVSYRPDGRLYDGQGVEPDLLIEPVPTDFTERTDTWLERAQQLIRQGGGGRRG